MSKNIIQIKGCDDCPFRNDYLYSTIGDNPTCNISQDKEINILKMHGDYRPEWCELNKVDSIEVLLQCQH